MESRSTAQISTLLGKHKEKTVGSEHEGVKQKMTRLSSNVEDLKKAFNTAATLFKFGKASQQKKGETDLQDIIVTTIGMVKTLDEILAQLDGSTKKTVDKLWCLKIKAFALMLETYDTLPGNKVEILSHAEIENQFSVLYEAMLARAKLTTADQSIRDDPASQEALFYLYKRRTVLLLTEKSDITVLLKNGSLLFWLLCNTTDSFLKLRIFRSVMMKYSLYLDRAPICSEPFEKTLNANISNFAQHYHAIKGRAAIQQENVFDKFRMALEIATSHLIAWQYDMVIFYINIDKILLSKDKKKSLNYDEFWIMFDLNETNLDRVRVSMQVIPDKVKPQELNAFLDFDGKNWGNLKQCLVSLQSVDFSKIPADYNLISFLFDTVDVLIWAAAKREEMFTELMQRKDFPDATQKRLITCATQSRVFAKLCMSFYSACSEYYIKLAGSERAKSAMLASDKAAHKAVDKLSMQMNIAIEQRQKMLKKLEAIIEKNLSDLTAWHQAQAARFDRKKSRKKSPLPGVVIKKDADIEAEDKPDVTIVHFNDLKHDIIGRFELLDKRAFQAVSALNKEIGDLYKLFQNELRTQTEFTDNELDTLDSKLQFLFKKRDELIELQKTYESLYEEFAIKLEGDSFLVKKSIDVLASLINQSCATILACASMLKMIVDQSLEEKREYILQLGRDKAESLSREMSEDELYKLGWEEFIKRGKINKEKGLSASRFSLKRSRLNECLQSVLSKLDIMPEKDEEDFAINVSLPEPIKKRFQLLQAIPGKTLLVGSSVAGLISGRYFQDCDFVTTCTNESDITKSCRNFYKCGHIERLFQFSDPELSLDLRFSDPRLRFDSLQAWMESDCETRDFTVDCLYADSDGNILDPTGRGLQDEKDNILSMRGNPLQKLEEDPVRLLRVVKKVLRGYEPDFELRYAIFQWQPSAGFDAKRMYHVVAKHLHSLRTEDKLKYAEKLIEYNLLLPLFGLEGVTSPAEALALIDDVKPKSSLTC